ncbi:uncharacterized protein PITG_06839 [Phytophthora infestans T30-4]|uniref:Uncharacterized protein n=1 Tax=Phytophthora infestans (strain T30-4) TaxID=403677 RepID=D0N6K6_PHYIT|nr:uncharacterized protein PITG_06839 [Phytophthora infestans T30-4]EEY53205.1 hypothetical protein PITG_06839 [Phytophthora infestans T30-4]|eukprot:XP_002904823.1 hypothetical protein PITG_06839 [Phytophthora infestans T30-4]
MGGAATNGHLEVVQWLHFNRGLQQGGDWRSCSLNVVQFLLLEFRRQDEMQRAFTAATSCGHVAKWVKTTYPEKLSDTDTQPGRKRVVKLFERKLKHPRDAKTTHLKKKAKRRHRRY